MSYRNAINKLPHEASELTFKTQASAGDNGLPMFSNTTMKLTFIVAGPLVSESAQITAETCLHPDVFCPSGNSLVDYVANIYCPVCEIRVDVDVLSCWESCSECNKPTESSDDDTTNNLDPIERDTTLELAPIRPWRQMNLTSSWLKPARQNTARHL